MEDVGDRRLGSQSFAGQDQVKAGAVLKYRVKIEGLREVLVVAMH